MQASNYGFIAGCLFALLAVGCGDSSEQATQQVGDSTRDVMEEVTAY